MSGVLRRSSTLLRTLQKQGPSFSNHQVSHSHHFPGSQAQSRPYFGKLPNFPRRIRECNDLTPTTAMFSSSSSAGAASSKVGLVGWYLGMVKSRPIITKSVTCALIYTAADLSSQHMTLYLSVEFSVLKCVEDIQYC
ncbi:hypothetical protein CRG98_008228 [Punica granatum]|uniref:Uncharacterized protein n=1 Tax=Punica granatum TaxID=22663 RepID=A0A2I0KSC3_PUNGR|nr:hypothetical protein CRG98_008228 [Punica granatum]